jgi:hypothetical protein
MKENGENYAICKNCNRVIDVDSIGIKWLNITRLKRKEVVSWLKR